MCFKRENEDSIIYFRYERLPVFCYYCGLFGHGEKECEAKLAEGVDGNGPLQYREWLKVPDEKKV